MDNISTISILTIALYLIGAVQGIVFGVILLGSSQENKWANRFLSCLLLLLSYRLLVQALRLLGLGYYDIWYYFMLDLSWITGALLYFYVKAQTVPDFRLKQSDSIHFLPLLVQVICSVFVRLQNLYWDGTRESLTWLGYWGYVVWMNYSTIYIVASILIIIYAVKSERLLLAPVDGVRIDPKRNQWLKRIILSFKVYFSLVLLILLVDLLVYNVSLGKNYFYFTRFYYYPFFAGISLLTYWIGMEGFRRKDYKGLSKEVELDEGKKGELEQIASRMEILMKEEKLYSEPELTLNALAERLEVKPYLVSQALKEICQTKFSDYINAKRVDELVRLLEDPQNAKFTLLSLALEAGFNSKSSYQRAVKKHLGKSPSELRPPSQN